MIYVLSKSHDAFLDFSSLRCDQFDDSSLYVVQTVSLFRPSANKSKQKFFCQNSPQNFAINKDSTYYLAQKFWRKFVLLLTTALIGGVFWIKRRGSVCWLAVGPSFFPERGNLRVTCPVEWSLHFIFYPLAACNLSEQIELCCTVVAAYCVSPSVPVHY